MNRKTMYLKDYETSTDDEKFIELLDEEYRITFEIIQISYNGNEIW